MPKSIPFQLLDRLQRPGKSTCFLVKVVCRDDGSVYGFATLDTDVTFNDGIHNVVYSARDEMRPQNMQQEANYEVDNTNLVGWFNSDLEKLVVAGKFNLAEITIYRVSYTMLSAGAEVIAYGNVGTIDFSADTKGKRTVEFRSLMALLQQTVQDKYSLLCRASFGDDRCGMPFIWANGTVASVGDDPYTKFTISGVTASDDYYILGIVEFLTGDNAGATMEVETWAASGQTQLSFLCPYPVKAGDTLRIRQDCDKTATACIGYGNIVNMRAEHLTPVQDKALMIPGAYIPSSGAQ